MNKNNLKGLVITIGIVLVVVCLIGLFFWLLPYILLGGVLIAVVVMVIRTIKNIKLSKNKDTNNYNDNVSYSDDFYSVEDINTDEAIDVEYQEVDKK